MTTHPAAVPPPALPAPPGRTSPRPGPASRRGNAPVPHPSTEAARLRRLIEAQSIINGDLSLADMLARIIRTACELVGSRYGALGVVGSNGQLEHLVHHGDDGQTESVVLPGYRRSLLELLGEQPGPLRVDDVPNDPRTARLEPTGDQLRSLLAVSIRVRGEMLGDIVLASPEYGVFTADDEELVSALASTAGTAITNARLYDGAKRTGEWQRASAEITHALLAEDDIDVLLDVVSRALDAAEADAGLLVLPDPDGTMRAAVAVGIGAEKLRNLTFRPDDSPMSRLMSRGTRFVRPSIKGLARTTYENTDNYGPIMMTPLADARGLRGSVVLIRTADRAPFTAADLDRLTAFGDQVTVALGLNDARTDAEKLRVLEVRHRIAQDLHDNVIQRLFATGMGLHALAESGLPDPAQAKLARFVTELDDTIDEVRERVFGLRDEAKECPLAAPRYPRVERPRPNPRAARSDRPRP